jgi:hypothetical protein
VPLDVDPFVLVFQHLASILELPDVARERIATANQRFTSTARLVEPHRTIIVQPSIACLHTLLG